MDTPQMSDLITLDHLVGSRDGQQSSIVLDFDVIRFACC